MSVNVQFSIAQDTATPAIAELMAKTKPQRLATICRDPLRGFWRDHLKNFPRLPGQFQAFPSTGFGEEAAQSVEALAEEGAVLLRADKQGLRLRYEGGTIRPVNAKVLCFGITEETYGKSFAEMVAQLGSRPVSEPLQGPRLKGKRTVKRQRTPDEVKAALRKQFAFAQSVTFAPNPAVVPPAEEFQAVAFAAIDRSLN